MLALPFFLPPPSSFSLSNTRGSQPPPAEDLPLFCLLPIRMEEGEMPTSSWC